MILDIVCGIILLFSLIMGIYRGFMESMIKTVGCLVSLVLSFVFSDTLAEWLKENTGYYEYIKNSLSENWSKFSTTSLTNNVPEVLKGSLNGILSGMGNNMITALTDALFKIISILLIIVALRIVFWLLITLFSKRKRDGFIGGVDSLLGAVFGILTGLFSVTLLLAIIFPFSGSGFLQGIAEGSKYAIIIYNNNPILFLTKLFL